MNLWAWGEVFVCFFILGSHQGPCSVRPHSCLSPVPPAPLTIWKSWEREGEGTGTADALGALDLLLGRLVEWADGGSRKEGVVSAAWHWW